MVLPAFGNGFTVTSLCATLPDEKDGVSHCHLPRGTTIVDNPSDASKRPNVDHCALCDLLLIFILIQIILRMSIIVECLLAKTATLRVIP